MKKLKLYLVYQNDVTGYDTFDSFVIACESEEIARNTHPYGDMLEENIGYSDWPKDSSAVTVEFIGNASKSITDQQIICASFNAG
jgi:hypothetical protein